ncbi:hypothetical protein [Formosa haliotis]|uniref:hypothetical protein n=1 Tax=Formosa haliotis TaxID=1555194 RepID=UPI00082559B5|nr:hypothetical protein [Formosa haliotis]
MKLLLTTICFCIGLFAFAQDPFLTIASKDSIDGIPKLKSSLGVNMKLNGYFDIFGGLQDNDTFNVGYINVFGTDDTKSLSIDMYQTQIKLQSTYIMKNGRMLTAVVESDFWGGNGRIRLRKAYVETEHWQIGQTWNNFGDEDIWPNIMEWEGPPSGVWVRNPHVKYSNTFRNPDFIYQVSLEAPVADYESFLEFKPLVEEVPQVTPDVTAALKYNRDWGHLRVSSIFRNIRYKLEGEIDNFIGYGFTVSGIYKSERNNNVQFQFIGGKGITAYMTTIGGRGYDGYAATNSEFTATPAFGGWASYEYYITKKLHANAVLGYTNFKLKDVSRVLVTDVNTDLDDVYLNGNVDHLQYYGLFNFMYDAYERMTVGLELDYGVKTLAIDGLANDLYLSNDKSRDAMRISFGFMYSF